MGSSPGGLDTGGGGIAGTIRAGAPASRPPFRGDPCVGYGLVLTVVDTSTWIVVRDGWTLGVTIELHDGRVVNVPAGRIVVTLRELERIEDNDIDAYLDWLDVPPRWTRRPLVPVDVGFVARLRVGDRVTLRAELEVEPRAVDYRTVPPLRTTGVPILAPAHRSTIVYGPV